MRLRFIHPAMLLVAAVIFTACNATDTTVQNNSAPKPASTPTGPGTTYADGADRITTAELDTMLKNGTAFIVDVRNQDAYDLGHIPGSKLIPVQDILNHLNELPKDKTIVTYCS